MDFSTLVLLLRQNWCFFLPLEEKVGSGAGKKGIFSANTAPGPRANTAHAKSVLSLPSYPVWVGDSHTFLRMVILPS